MSRAVQAKRKGVCKNENKNLGMHLRNDRIKISCIKHISKKNKNFNEWILKNVDCSDFFSWLGKEVFRLVFKGSGYK